MSSVFHIGKSIAGFNRLRSALDLATDLIATARAFVRDRRGVAAVEFTLIAPVIFILALGAIEIREAVSADRKLNIIATSIGDLVARTPVLREADVEDMYTIVDGLLGRYGANDVGMVVTAANIDEDGKATAVWSRVNNSPGSVLAKAYGVGEDLDDDIDEALRMNESLSSGETQLIFVEIFMTYMAVPDFIGIDFLRNSSSQIMELNLSDHAFNLPRLSSSIRLCPDNWIPANGFANCEG